MWAWYEGLWAVVGLESSFIKFFWSVCSEPTTSVKGAFPGKEKGYKSFWAPMILVGVAWGAPHRMCLLWVMELSEHKHFSNTCWSQPDVSDTHVILWDRFLQAFASVGQKWLKMTLLLAAEVVHRNFPHRYCFRNPVTAIPSLSCCCQWFTYRCQSLA